MIIPPEPGQLIFITQPDQAAAALHVAVKACRVADRRDPSVAELRDALNRAPVEWLARVARGEAAA